MTNKSEITISQNNGNLPATRKNVLERYVTPSADVAETPDAFVLMIDIPGAEKETISVSIAKDTLTITAPVKPHYKDNAKVLFSELRSTTYYRVFALGDGVDRDAVDAHYEDGVLQVRLSKTEKMKPREISIQ
ncbi:MAG: Hsp20/alpha crystallin family protein [Bacteroidota bacterium]